MNEKAKTVHEVAKLTGITARTLHYYDEIGLLKPSIITEAKYRQYTDDDCNSSIFAFENAENLISLFPLIVSFTSEIKASIRSF